MSIQKLFTPFSRTPEALGLQSRPISHLPRAAHRMTPSSHGGVNSWAGFRATGRQQQPSRAYATYRFRDLMKDHFKYEQMGSRLAYMAVGSALTILVYYGYTFSRAKPMPGASKDDDDDNNDDSLWALISSYEEPLAKAVTDNDGSPAGKARIQSILMERAMILALYGVLVKGSKGPLRNMEGLPRLPKGHPMYNPNGIKSEDTIVLLSPPLTAKQLAEDGARAKMDAERMPAYHFVVSINATDKELGLDVPGDPYRCKFHEVCPRLEVIIERLQREGTLDPKRSSMVTFILQNKILACAHFPGALMQVDLEDWLGPGRR